MSQFGQKDWLLEAEVCPILKFHKKVKTSKRLFGEHFSQIFEAAFGHPFRGGAFHLSQFGQKSRSYEIKVWPRLKFLNKLQNDQKWFGEQFLELFAADTRSFQVNELCCR